MQETVLLSIKPEFANKILCGEKHFEYRRTLFTRSSVNKVMIYATSPVCQVIGEFEVEGVITMSKHALWRSTRNLSGITWRHFSEYFKGKTCCHAIRVRNPIRYNSPVTLREASGMARPPQSFAYMRRKAVIEKHC